MMNDLDKIGVSSPEGPPSYENWKACISGLPSQGASEYPLFTDADIRGEVTVGCGPYQLLNAVPMSKDQISQPSIILRVEFHLSDEPDFSKFKEMENEETPKSKVDYYHGGWLNDEIAALLSLCLGIRIKAGGSTRRFNPNGDPRGHPEAFHAYENPVLIKSSFFRPTLPYISGVRNLNDLVLFPNFPKISLGDACALVQAARLYQDAVWIADSEPALSWVMLVSAIETAAGHWRQSKESPIEKLRASRPELVAKLVEVGGNDLASYMADQIADSIGATKKFIDFVLEFLPDPPLQRPSAGFQLSWDKSYLKKSLNIIYKWRSRALHSGVPFPRPMCEPAFSEGGAFSEKPLGLAAMVSGAVWVAEDTPLMLHVFEYIVRGALLKWWESILRSA
jgi:hypothetical protein